MRTDLVQFADVPRLAAAARAAGAPFAQALEAAQCMPEAERVISTIDPLAARLQAELTAGWAQRTDERYATFAHATRVVVALSLFALLPAAILLVAFRVIPFLVISASVLVPVALLVVGLAITEVGARRDYAAAAEDLDAAFDALDGAVLGADQATCPLGARQILRGPYREVYGQATEQARAA